MDVCKRREKYIGLVYYTVYIGTMEKNMEATIVYWGYIGVTITMLSMDTGKPREKQHYHARHVKPIQDSTPKTLDPEQRHALDQRLSSCRLRG